MTLVNVTTLLGDAECAAQSIGAARVIRVKVRTDI